MRWLLVSVFFMLTIAAPCYGVRDIFNIEVHCFNKPLISIVSLGDLQFKGAIIENDQGIGFIEDSLGNIYQLRLGQTVGDSSAKVIRILRDEILLSDGQHYTVLK